MLKGKGLTLTCLATVCIVAAVLALWLFANQRERRWNGIGVSSASVLNCLGPELARRASLDPSDPVFWNHALLEFLSKPFLDRGGYSPDIVSRAVPVPLLGASAGNAAVPEVQVLLFIAPLRDGQPGVVNAYVLSTSSRYGPSPCVAYLRSPAERPADERDGLAFFAIAQRLWECARTGQQADFDKEAASFVDSDRFSLACLDHKIVLSGRQLSAMARLLRAHAFRQFAAADDPSPRPWFKGYELYSWQNPDGSWDFSLLIGTNRNKTVEEIFDKKVSIHGLDQLKERISQLPEGTHVVWLDCLIVGNAKAKGSEALKYPSAQMTDDVARFAAEHGGEVVGP